MKKLITTIFTFSLFVISFAQTHYGVKAGYNNSIMRFEYGKLDSRSSFYIGGFLENKIGEKISLQSENKKISLQSELLFTQIGGKTNVELFHLVGDQVLSEGYLDLKFIYTQFQIPIYANYFINENLAFNGGLNFTFNVDSKLKNDYNIEMYEASKIKNSKTLNIFPFIGAKYNFSPLLFADVRYNLGVSNINKDGIDLRSRFFQIGLGYKF